MGGRLRAAAFLLTAASGWSPFFWRPPPIGRLSLAGLLGVVAFLLAAACERSPFFSRRSPSSCPALAARLGARWR
jgi:hypothetical protein